MKLSDVNKPAAFTWFLITAMVFFVFYGGYRVVKGRHHPEAKKSYIPAGTYRSIGADDSDRIFYIDTFGRKIYALGSIGDSVITLAGGIGISAPSMISMPYYTYKGAIGSFSSRSGPIDNISHIIDSVRSKVRDSMMTIRYPCNLPCILGLLDLIDTVIPGKEYLYPERHFDTVVPGIYNSDGIYHVYKPTHY